MLLLLDPQIRNNIDWSWKLHFVPEYVYLNILHSNCDDSDSKSNVQTFAICLREGLAITSLDISIFSIFCVQILVNISLLVGTVKRIPSHTLPWLCANAVSIMIAMVCIVITILFGTTKLSLNYSEYVTSLVILGLVTGINLFCWIVVFTFRKNLIMEAQMARFPSGTDDPSSVNTQCQSTQMPNAPPPSYYEIEDYKECKPPPEDAPPEYEEAVSMLYSECTEDTVQGPVLRKKSLTNNAV